MSALLFLLQGMGAAAAASFKPDYDAVRKSIEDLLESNEGGCIAVHFSVVKIGGLEGDGGLMVQQSVEDQRG